MNLKKEGLEKIRKEIDSIDEEIISLIAKRYEFVKSATDFKDSEKSVLATERQKEMNRKRKLIAKKHNLPIDLIESVYSKMIKYFTEKQMELWQKRK
ncbi:MAG: chorismate mutase [Bacteroidota bacterium]|nr:chorismate mutase [Bacteroidota bacterium]